MPPEKIHDDDIVSRTILDPKDVALIMGVPQLDLKSNFQFNLRNGRREESVNCMRLFKGNPVSACDEQGQKKCSITNERNKEKAGFKPNKYYGYRSARVQCIRDKNYKGISFNVEHTPKNDNHAHCDVVMLNGDAAGLKTHDRQMAKEKLVKCFDIEVKWAG